MDPNDLLIEETAKAIFFRDMVDGEIDQSLYSVWEFDTEPNTVVGDRIREKYRTKAREYLADLGAICQDAPIYSTNNVISCPRCDHKEFSDDRNAKCRNCGAWMDFIPGRNQKHDQ